MNALEIKELHDLANSKGATVRFMFSYVYEVKVNGKTYQAAYHDCIKILNRAQ